MLALWSICTPKTWSLSESGVHGSGYQRGGSERAEEAEKTEELEKRALAGRLIKSAGRVRVIGVEFVARRGAVAQKQIWPRVVSPRPELDVLFTY